MIACWRVFLLLAPVATAAFSNNLNYGSPSRRHPHLDMSIPRLSKRDGSSVDPETLRFTHGVASGDPLPNSIILWTRVAPTMKSDASNITVDGDKPRYSHDTETYIEADPNPVCVEYKVGTSRSLSSVVDKGKAYTTANIDYTVKVRVIK